MCPVRRLLLILLWHLTFLPVSWQLTKNGTVESVEADGLTLDDVSDEDIDVENVEVDDYFFLQPLPSASAAAARPPGRPWPAQAPPPAPSLPVLWGQLPGELSFTHLRPRSSRGALRTGGTSVTFLAGFSLFTFGTRLAISTLAQEGGSQ